MASSGTVGATGVGRALAAIGGIRIAWAGRNGQDFPEQEADCDVSVIDAALLCEMDNGACQERTDGRVKPAPRIVIDGTVRHDRLLRAIRIGARGYWSCEDPFERFVAGVYRVASGGWSFAPSVRQCLHVNSSGVSYQSLPDQLPVIHLTQRQNEILSLLVRGLTTRECAKILQLAPSTIENHKRAVMDKLCVRRTVDLLRIVMIRGLLLEEESVRSSVVWEGEAPAEP